MIGLYALTEGEWSERRVAFGLKGIAPVCAVTVVLIRANLLLGI